MKSHRTDGTVVACSDDRFLQVVDQDGEIIGSAKRHDDPTTALLLMLSVVKLVGSTLSPIIDITVDAPGMRARILHEEGIEYIDLDWSHDLA